MTKFNNGDKVVLTEHCATAGFEIGDRVIILNYSGISSGENCYGIKNDSGIHGYAKESGLVKTVKRKAKLGEKVLIVDTVMSAGNYNIGDILEVSWVDDGGGIYVKITDGLDFYLIGDEYEVIDEKDDDNLTTLQDEINDLKDELKTLKSELGNKADKQDVELIGRDVETLKEREATRESESHNEIGVKVGDRIEVVRDLMRDTRPFVGWRKLGQGLVNEGAQGVITHVGNDSDGYYVTVKFDANVTDIDGDRTDTLDRFVLDVKEVRVIDKPSKKPNQERISAIQAAKEFVEKFTTLDNNEGPVEFMGHRNIYGGALMVVPDFEVLGDKVSVRYKGAINPITYAEGSATCKDGEVFNKHIGKAIAISKALNEELPEILQGDIPQPVEAVVGMEVVCEGNVSPYNATITTETGIYENVDTLKERPHLLLEILDDTNAEYEIQGVRV